MPDNKKPRLPYSLLALDIVGALLVAAGFMNRIGDNASIEGYLYMGLGFALMLPLVLHFLKRQPNGSND